MYNISIQCQFILKTISTLQIKTGADDDVTQHRYTELMLEIINNNFDHVKELMRNGADYNIFIRKKQSVDFS